MADFHWLRPWWLAGLVPLVLVMLYLWRQHHSVNPWQQQIAPHLLPYLLVNDAAPTKARWIFALGLAWLLMFAALAGPTWEKRTSPSFKPNQALVILLDLSLSMQATDLEPTRLDRAKFKIKDILLHQKRDKTGAGLFALVAYAGDAHVVTPLTDDHNTIEAMLPALNSLIMPVPGSKPELAAQAGIELIQQAQLKHGQLLLITDDMHSSSLTVLQKLLDASNLSLSLGILGVGSDQGAPVPLPNGSFVKNTSGQPVIARLDHDKMQVFAEQLGARYRALTANDDDIHALLARLPKVNDSASSSEKRFDDWQDNGPWLVLLLLPFAAALFRRGWLWSVLLLPLAGLPTQSYAFEWQDLWLTPEQQAQRAYQQQDYAKASERFEDPAYKGLAAYRQGDYTKASEALAQAKDLSSLYNLGNALAKAQQFEQAIQVYEQVLKQQPDHQDAAFNKTLLEKLAEQNKQQANQQQSNQQQAKQQQSNQEQSNQEQSNQAPSDQQQSDQANQQKNPSPDQQKPSDASSPSHQPANPSAAPTPAAALSATASPATATPASNLTQAQNSGEPSANPDDAPPQNQAADREDVQQEEANQALTQWLEQVPDDPSGLLRRKFLQQSQQSQSNPSSKQAPSKPSHHLPPATDQQGYW